MFLQFYISKTLTNIPLGLFACFFYKHVKKLAIQRNFLVPKW